MLNAVVSPDEWQWLQDSVRFTNSNLLHEVAHLRLHWRNNGETKAQKIKAQERQADKWAIEQLRSIETGGPDPASP